MKTYPAIDVAGHSADLILASVDDFQPTAAEERGSLLRVFFATVRARDAARECLAADYHVTSIDVPDENWALRSQENLTPVTVGRITILPQPPWRPSTGHAESSRRQLAADSITLVIPPSMGFGTGHHPTTRLCLRALETIDVSGKSVLDIGTGSGVLAIAASRLGAARVVGIDNDADAIESADRNLTLNPEARQTTFARADLLTDALPPADIVMANLTGPLLARSAPLLLGAIGSRGLLIVSGALANERKAVRRSFDPACLVWEQGEEEWIAMAFAR